MLDKDFLTSKCMPSGSISQGALLSRHPAPFSPQCVEQTMSPAWKIIGNMISYGQQNICKTIKVSIFYHDIFAMHRLCEIDIWGGLPQPDIMQSYKNCNFSEEEQRFCDMKFPSTWTLNEVIGQVLQDSQKNLIVFISVFSKNLLSTSWLAVIFEDVFPSPLRTSATMSRHGRWPNLKAGWRSCCRNKWNRSFQRFTRGNALEKHSIHVCNWKYTYIYIFMYWWWMKFW